MATGSGKTIVMAMLIAWQVLNKVTYPQDARYSKHVFVVAPGLTVKSRLQVLEPAGTSNYYDEFNIVRRRSWTSCAKARSWSATGTRSIGNPKSGSRKESRR